MTSIAAPVVVPVNVPVTTFDAPPPECVPLTPKMLIPLAIFAGIRFASPKIVCAPVRYVSLAIVWLVVVGV